MTAPIGRRPYEPDDSDTAPVEEVSTRGAALVAPNYEYAIFHGDNLWSSGFTSPEEAQAQIDNRVQGTDFHVRRRPYGQWEPITHAKARLVHVEGSSTADGGDEGV